MCFTPITLSKNEAVVPCGVCPKCKARRVSAWSFRLMQEFKVCQSAKFITLTYDNSHIPITRKNYMSLQKRDLQLYFKRLRKANPEAKIKYYAAGEYGGITMRPHYHIILFNAKIETIDAAWNMGNVHFGDLTEASVGYTLKYINKTKREKKPVWYSDQQPEFSLMSKGIGKTYLTPEIIFWHKNDMENRCYVNIPDGKKATMCRYYKDRIYSESERLAVSAAGKKRIDEAVKIDKSHRDWLNRKAGIKAAIDNAVKINKQKDKL